MKVRLIRLWESRAPRERKIIIALAIVVGLTLYVALMQTAWRARTQLRTSVTSLRAQAATLDQQAGELERLRAAPGISASPTDLRTLLQSEAASAGLSRSLVRIDAMDHDQVVVVFGSVPYADWHNWIASLKSQQVRIDTCRIEALSTPGLVSVTATLARPKPK